MGNSGQATEHTIHQLKEIVAAESESQAEAFVHEFVTVADTAIGLTPNTYGDATRAFMTLEGAQIRVWTDGTDPTLAEGHVADVGSQIILQNAAEIAAFRAIRTTDESGKLVVTYSK